MSDIDVSENPAIEEVVEESVEEPVEESVEDSPVEDAPVEDSPVEDAPVEDAPVEDAPVEEAPVEEVSQEVPSTQEVVQNVQEMLTTEPAVSSDSASLEERVKVLEEKLKKLVTFIKTGNSMPENYVLKFIFITLIVIFCLIRISKTTHTRPDTKDIVVNSIYVRVRAQVGTTYNKLGIVNSGEITSS